jgi:threonine dehydratase
LSTRGRRRSSTGPSSSFYSRGRFTPGTNGVAQSKGPRGRGEDDSGSGQQDPPSRVTGALQDDGLQVYLKLECFQPIKVFKIRGAYNKISRLGERSVVAASSGNHGIAVAYSSRLLGKRCTIVVPETIVKEKAETISDYGAEVVRAGRFSHEREAKAREIAGATNSAFVHPFNDPQVIAGQGTCGLEISEQLGEFDSVLVPVGGGGLISGISIALKAREPKAKVFGVEPASAPKLKSALNAKRIVAIPSPASMADGLIPSALGELTFEACARYVDGAFTATEDEIFNATRVMATKARIIAEPSGAAPLAPLLSHAGGLGQKVVVVVSGGNISQDLLAKILA